MCHGLHIVDAKNIKEELSKLQKKSNTKKQNDSVRRGYLELLRNIAIMAVLLLIAFTQVFLITPVKGTDMYPAILDGDILIGYRLGKNYLKNDVVVCRVDGQKVIGRVAARAGDSVDITEDGRLFVNGTEQTGEIAFPAEPGNQTYPYTVSEGCVYILGDYRTHTTDSWDFGPVAIENIKGKVISLFRRSGI